MPFRCFIQQIKQKYNFKFFHILFFIKFKNKEYFIKEIKLSNILNDNEQKSIQFVQCFQFFTQFETRHSK
jgi:hypothetical protein